MFSKLSENEKNELYQFLSDEFNLEYRNGLLLPEDVTFGIEIEVSSEVYNLESCIGEIDWIKNSLQNIGCTSYDDWQLVEEMSVYRGYELVSPILTDTSSNWKMVAFACDILNYFMVTTDNCGAHVHIGADATIQNNPRNLLNFFKIVSAYEDVLYKFGYGKKAVPRKTVIGYAAPISKDVIEIMSSLKINALDYKELLNQFWLSRDRFINIENMRNWCLGIYIKNTIEFRGANGTTNEMEWQNLVNAYAKTLLYSSSENFDDELVSYRLFDSKKPIFWSSDGYSDIYFDRALEFVDLVFDNDLDKLNFLVQYISKQEEPLTLSLNR